MAVTNRADLLKCRLEQVLEKLTVSLGYRLTRVVLM